MNTALINDHPRNKKLGESDEYEHISTFSLLLYIHLGLISTSTKFQFIYYVFIAFKGRFTRSTGVWDLFTNGILLLTARLGILEALVSGLSLFSLSLGVFTDTPLLRAAAVTGW